MIHSKKSSDTFSKKLFLYFGKWTFLYFLKKVLPKFPKMEISSLKNKRFQEVTFRARKMKKTPL